jgi:hypothetical protein
MPIEQVAKLSGHTQLSTIYAHYVSVTSDALRKAVELLNQMNGSGLSRNEQEGAQGGFIN